MALALTALQTIVAVLKEDQFKLATSVQAVIDKLDGIVPLDPVDQGTLDTAVSDLGAIHDGLAATAAKATMAST